MATVTSKALARIAAATSSTTLYTVPASTTTVVTNITVTNSAASAATFTIQLDAGDMAVIGPLIRDLIDTSVKNDDQLVKLANLAQKLIVSEKKSEGDDGFLSAFEKEQLLKDIEDTQLELERVDELENEIEELKLKVK